MQTARTKTAGVAICDPTIFTKRQYPRKSAVKLQFIAVRLRVHNNLLDQITKNSRCRNPCVVFVQRVNEVRDLIRIDLAQARMQVE